MIEGFERETHELTSEEAMLVDPMVMGLRTKWGKDNAITSDEMIEAFKSLNIKVTGPRIRKLINYIRVNGLVTNLVSSSLGYYRTNDAEDLERYKRSLRQRINSISEVLESFN